jgi:hypothetical protein
LEYKYNSIYVSNLEKLVATARDEMLEAIGTCASTGWIVTNCWSKILNLLDNKLLRKFDWEIDFSSKKLATIKTNINTMY